MIKEYIRKHCLDIIGISEGNVDADLEPCLYNMDGYTSFKSNGKIARMFVYVRDDLVCREVSGLGSEILCKWLEIGKGRTKTVVGQYYREFKVLGKEGSQCFRGTSQ